MFLLINDPGKQSVCVSLENIAVIRRHAGGFAMLVDRDGNDFATASRYEDIIAKLETAGLLTVVDRGESDDQPGAESRSSWGVV